jgi:trans-2,3-dihydro-3-hydroxyanthranilate isomerase
VLCRCVTSQARSPIAEATVAAVASSAPDRLDYEVVDVFAPWPFSGNQLAVVLDAGSLTTAQCQTLAAEFGYSESTFVSAATDADHPGSGGGPTADHPGTGGGPTADYRVRIFTPQTELPFAGHPSVGTAHTLVRLGRAPAGVLRQQCGVGVVDVEVDADGARLTGGPVSLRPGPDPAALAAAVGLADADATGRPAHLVGCGIDFAQLEVHPDALDRAVPDPAALRALLPDLQGGISVLAWDAAAGRGTVRVFAAGLDWHEDPATGSAALGTGIWLASVGLAGDGVTDYLLAQGAAVGRPSELAGRVTVAGGAATRVSVAGAVRPVAAGTIRVPAC